MLSLMPPMDAIFLAVEKPTNPMHVAGLHLFAPPPDGNAESVRTMFTEAGEVAAYFRRRAVQSRGGRWNWQLEPTAQLSYHVREHLLPSPAGMPELLELCAALHGQPLDRDRPLWQAHLISGLADGRFALYFKLHHALGDGQQSQRLLRQTLSRDASRRKSSPPWLGAEAPPTVTSGRGTGGLFGELASLASMFGRAMLVPGPATAGAPRTILNPRTISGQRRFATGSWPLQRIRAVAKGSGVSTNDVVLAVCGGALRHYLDSRSALPDESLVAMVPIALRTNGPLGDTGTHQPAGNSVGALLCELGTDSEDPSRRLMQRHELMVRAKAGHQSMTPTQVLAATAITMAPLILEPLRTRSRPPFNLIISNVRTSPAPLYFNGARLDEVYPLSIPVDGQALNITCTIYARQILFGLTCCPVHLPDPERLLAYMQDELAALELILEKSHARRTSISDG
jgi:diacylglycerol O-acyltransferase